MPTLLYDADCGFCTQSAHWLRRRHLGAAIEPLQRADLITLGVDAERAAREIPFVSGHPGQEGETGTTVSYGAEAIARALLTGGPGWRLAGGLMLRPPIAWLAAPIYSLVAANRHRLPGASESCRID